VEEPVLSRVFDYWRNVDHTLGDRVEEAVIGRIAAKIV
jgi:catalase